MARTSQSPLDKVPTNAARGRKPTKPQRTTKRSPEDTRRPMQLTEARARGINTSTYEAAEQIDPDKPLTEKQKAFVRFWAQGESIISASHKAGYADGATFAYRMVRMPNVLALYNEEKRLYEESCQMTRKRVMEGLLEGIEMAKLAGEPASMISGWREVGKMCGYYEPVTRKVEISVVGRELNARLQTMSDQELMDLITAGATNEAEGSE